MEGDNQDPTQPTQNVLDPRRVGKQNSGFSDDDISDIICLLYPYSQPARREVANLALNNNRHIVGRDEAAAIEPDYEREDEADKFHIVPPNTGDHAIILKLSSQVNSPLQGFQFGRNLSRCDICFANDPMRRMSNVHFRIYVNNYGVVMLEDQSINGTFVDGHLLKGRSQKGPVDNKRTLSHGSKVKVLMHSSDNDLEFLVRIPKREGEHDKAYTENLRDYFDVLNDLRADHEKTVTPDPGDGGHPNLFATPKARPGRRTPLNDEPKPKPPDFPREWKGSEKYNKVGQIGKGAFAVVHKVTSKFDGNPYAAKELEKRRFMKNGILDQKVDNEMKIMQRVNHPNVVRYIEHFDWENRLLIIIMEYVPGGDLGKLVSDCGTLREDIAQQMSSQLLSALGYLHENNITHRDVKPDNILIQSLDPFEVKLTDFGLSKVVDNEQTFLRTFCGTLLYCAPEVYSEFAEYDDDGFRQPRNKARRAPPGQRYDHAVDIWSLGGVIFYAVTGQPPYPVRNGISYSELLHQIMTTQLNTMPLLAANASRQAVDFLCMMLERRPEVRASIPTLKAHPWMSQGGDEGEHSLDEITDDEDLHVGASQLSLQEGQGRRVMATAAEPDDAIMDDFVDEFLGDEPPNQAIDPNNTFGNPGNQAQKLFGEVGVSAVGSSGVIPEDRLNISLPGQDYPPEDSMETEIEGGQGQSRNPSVIRHHTAGGGGNTGQNMYTSVANGQSADQLPSLVMNVQSQSLGAAESAIVDPLQAKSAAGINANDSYWTASKRRKQDISDEFDERPQEKPTVKRLRSEGTIDALADQANEEMHLLASLPLVKRLESGRQIDGPQDKMVFWAHQNVSTWHLHYPEMTELQRSVFDQGAEARGETFNPGKTKLWDLAMKYFPPSQGSPSLEDTRLLGVSSPETTASRQLQNDAGVVESEMTVPSTAPQHEAGEEEEDSLPDTLPPPTQRVVPVFTEPGAGRTLAILESAPDSVLPGISINVADSMVSWGRGPDNTVVYTPRSETKVPKYAVKVLLWKDGFDPSKRATHRAPSPWNRDAEGAGYNFYLATKATMGVHINGFHLPSSTSPGAASSWTQIYEGDEIVVWGKGDDDAAKTKLVFRCFWGGSSEPRSRAVADGGATAVPQIVSNSTARKLDEACIKTEKRVKSDAERNRRISEAERDMRERKGRIERERERTRVFEEKVLEAREVLKGMKGFGGRGMGLRRESPASAPALTMLRGGTPDV